MVTICTTTQNDLVNAVLRATNYTAPASVLVALFTADPTDAGTVTSELSDATYARQAATFSSPASGVTSNSAAIEFGPFTTGGQTIAYFGIMRPAAGAMLIHGALTASKTPAAGDYVRFSATNLSVQFR